MRLLPLALLSAILTGCCLTGLIDKDRFAAAPLEQKVQIYERGIRRHCVTNDMPWLLDDIASHGEPAADVMTELFRNPRPHFPLEHAMDVFERTREYGVDVRRHPGWSELERLAASDPRLDVRLWAQDTLRTLGTSRTPNSVDDCSALHRAREVRARRATPP